MEEGRILRHDRFGGTESITVMVESWWEPTLAMRIRQEKNGQTNLYSGELELPELVRACIELTARMPSPLPRSYRFPVRNARWTRTNRPITDAAPYGVLVANLRRWDVLWLATQLTRAVTICATRRTVLLIPKKLLRLFSLL